MSRSRKRQLCVEVEPTTDSSSPPLTVKRRKLEKQQRHRTPSWFWDNLSRLWLTPRALREFNRRTERPIASLPPNRIDKKDIDLRRFARHGGPSLENLRAYPEIETAMSSSQSGSRKRAKTGKESDISSETETESEISTNTKKSSAYDSGFEQHLIDHGVYPYGYDYNDNDNSVYPDNWEEINKRLAQPRASLSPSRFPREDFRKFEKTNMHALTETSVMSKAFSIIAGTADIPSQQNLLFGNLKDLTDGSITKAKPNYYDGSRPTNLNMQIRKELGPYIVPSTITTAPCLPNFFTEGKGPDGKFPAGKRQALYNGALGARGIHKLRLYVNSKTAYDNNAYTITSTYHGGSGSLTVYTTHPTPSKDSKTSTEYRMTQLNSFAMTGNPETFRQGASALRNARDWAQEKREEIIAAANDKMLNAGHSSSTQGFVSVSSDEVTSLESETSADELALDASSSHKTPVRAQTPKVSSNRQAKEASNQQEASGTPEASQVI